MKYTVILLSFMLCLASCGGNDTAADNAEEQTSVSVTVTHGKSGHIKQELVYPATTAYQNKSVITAPVSGYILQSFVQAGARVSAGQLIYNLESKERHAVGGQGSEGIIPIKAMRSGIVLDVLQLTGNYVSENTILCTIADSGSLVFEINVPYEQRQRIKTGSNCRIILPDGTELTASVKLPLATMNQESQSERILASARTSFLPEGLHAKAVFTVSNGVNDKNCLIFPESAVQSDETLTEHWVMKLVDESTVVKVPVEVVERGASEVEIRCDGISPEDNIVLTGGYGLETGMKVTITK